MKPVKLISFLILLWGLGMMILGIAMMLFPEIIVQAYGLEPKNNTGWSALSGNFATLIFFLGLCAFWGIVKNNAYWLFNTLILEAIIFVGRIVAIYQFGFSFNVGILLAAEMGIALLIVYRLMVYAREEISVLNT